MDPSSEAVETILDKGATRTSVLDYESEDIIQPLYPWLSPTAMNAISGTVAGTISDTFTPYDNIAGLAGVIAGHPFDTVKVRLQNDPGHAAYRTTFHTFKTIIKEESSLGLFKGMSSPLVGVAVINASLFGVYGYILHMQQEWSGDATAEPTLTQIYWAGAGSGLANSLISGPTELAKIQLQVQKETAISRKRRAADAQRLKGPVDCLKRIFKVDGMRGCFRGMGATILRETPSYGVYFATFEVMQRKFLRPKSEEGSFMRSLKLMTAGGISGVLGWISSYPMDVIKTKIQAQPIDHRPAEAQYKGIIDCAQRLVQSEGPGSLWRGLGATVIRAFPTNAVIFLAYSTAIDALDSLNYPSN